VNAPSALASKYSVLAADMLEVSVDGEVDHVIMDPPYADRTQGSIRHGRTRGGGICSPTVLGFDAATADRRTAWARWAFAAARKWVITFSDHESSMDWADALESAGLVYVRTALWVRTGDVELTANRPRHSGAPQFTGTEPAQGHECIVLAHRPGKRSWNCGGLAAIYTSPVVPHAERLHPAQKPLGLMQDIIGDFTQPGDSIVDPFCGVGTTIVAAKSLGRQAFGIEIAAKHADLARRRVAASASGG
jgi:site-specific DNA-methyltransferase (adenine-specific)